MAKKQRRKATEQAQRERTRRSAQDLAAGVTPHRLPIDQIRTDGDTQPRAGIHPETVRRYARLATPPPEGNGVMFPPLDVMFDGEDYWLYDGFHRLEAFKRLGYTEVDIRVKRGTLADARWESFAANKTHGLNRTRKDIKRAVLAAFLHERSYDMSNRAIADHIGVDHKTVGKYRKELEEAEQIPEVTTRQTADGRVMNTRKIAQSNVERTAAAGNASSDGAETRPSTGEIPQCPADPSAPSASNREFESTGEFPQCANGHSGQSASTHAEKSTGEFPQWDPDSGEARVSDEITLIWRRGAELVTIRTPHRDYVVDFHALHDLLVDQVEQPEQREATQ